MIESNLDRFWSFNKALEKEGNASEGRADDYDEARDRPKVQATEYEHVDNFEASVIAVRPTGGVI